MKGENKKQQHRINEQIRVREVRIVGDDVESVVVPTKEALQMAEDKGVDLVEISPNANPPVCKILDYGKFRYETQKRAKDAKKKQRTIQVKEIRLSAFIEDHDINVKANTACKFLKDGDKVKVSLRFRGRELGHTDLGRDVMTRFAEMCKEVGSIDKNPVMEGRVLSMILTPKTEKELKEAAKKEESDNGEE